MSKKDKPKIELPSVEEVSEYGGKPTAGEEAGKPAEQPVAEPDPLADALRERDQWRDKFLRAKAETQNVQRRLTGERAEAVRYAIVEFLRDLLGTLDDFERSFEAADSAKTPQSVIDGMRIVYENLRKVLRDHQVTPIDAIGKPFDPAEHQAVTQQLSDQHETPTVLQELQRGYKLHDRVVRPAKVIISAPREPAEAEGAEGQDYPPAEPEPPKPESGGA